ncbi:MAG: hypothetical protein HC838_02050 [Spirulinaceae cyanobacterium RM2_2_10]|nr:hypothetical protein [Spirulinaceae cyanobacterium RM2_2_10]
MVSLTKPHRCPGLFYVTPAPDGYLLRIRTPGGLLTAQQAAAITAAAQQWQCEILQVTNRANLQLRALPTAPTAEVLQDLQAAGLAAPKSSDRSPPQSDD